MTDEQQRIRSYLQAQGAKLTPAEMVEKVQAAMRELRAAAALVPPARFTQKPGRDEWSGNEVMAHVVAAGRYFSGAIMALSAGQPLTARPAGRGHEDAPPLPAEAWLWLLLIAVVSTVVAVSAFFAGLRLVGPSEAAILSTFEPVVTVVLAYMVLGERLSPAQLAGGALVLAAVVLLQLRPRRAPRTSFELVEQPG